MAPSDVIEKKAIWVHNYSPSRVQQLKHTLENLLRVWLFGAHKLVHSEPFLDYPCELWQLLPAPYGDMLKKIQRYISTFLALKYCGGISLKSFCYLYEVVGIDLWCKWNFVVFCSKLTNYYRLSLSVSMKSVSLFYINAQSHIEIYANNAIIITCWELWHYWLSSLSNPRRFSVGRGEPL